MSYAQGTTHYNLPQTLGDDKRDWFDTNKPFADVDAALYTAYEGVQTLDKDISTVKTELVEAQTDIRDIQSHDATVDVKVSALETLTTQHSTEIEDVRNDCEDMVCALEEPTATAKYEHKVDGYFRFNDTLYVATKLISIGDTIVPNVNCRTTDIVSELGGDATLPGKVSKLETQVGDVDISSYGATVTGAIANSGVRYVGGKLMVLEDGVWKELNMSGGLPILDYSNPIATITEVGATEVAEDCYLVGSICQSFTGVNGTSSTTLSINGCGVGGALAYLDGERMCGSGVDFNLHLSKGDTITIASTNSYGYLIKVALLKEK